MLGTVLRARTRGASISAVFAVTAEAPAGRNPGRLTQTEPKKELHENVIINFINVLKLRTVNIYVFIVKMKLSTLVLTNSNMLNFASI